MYRDMPDMATMKRAFTDSATGRSKTNASLISASSSSSSSSPWHVHVHFAAIEQMGDATMRDARTNGSWCRVTRRGVHLYFTQTVRVAAHMLRRFAAFNNISSSTMCEIVRNGEPQKRLRFDRLMALFTSSCHF
jgi:hypothetical protein